jgi:2-polyprenyl-3-methyl-5-hydroxy-6-metoxy-1,4-benzoquinol methylase
MRHRNIASSFLYGNGLEIGALHQPLAVPQNCKVEYLNVKSQESLIALFPEVKNIVKNEYVGNINNQSVYEITNNKFNFIIANHVIEHLPNPINAIKNICDALLNDGILVISIPDKRNSYDKNRALTGYYHILADYYLSTQYNSDENIIEVLYNTNPDCFSSQDKFLIHFNSIKSRNEHIHVWTSDTFEDHLHKIFKLLNLNMQKLHQSKVEDNGVEYFGIFKYCK